jgi:hypothetical protein
MWCTKCRRDIADCICPDIEERLRSIAAASPFAYRYCRRCGKHYARCRCADPTWAVKAGADA